MRILYIGDIMGSFGVRVIKDNLEKIKNDQKIDIVIAQSENVTNGKGISLADYNLLKSLGVDFFTGGNHSFNEKSILSKIFNRDEPIIAPANFDRTMVDFGAKVLKTSFGSILIVSLLGQIVGKDSKVTLLNPLITIDEILNNRKNDKYIATIVNFHGDYSSEKIVIGHYLDGRVSAVIGDHWHVPTADARILPGGTAHITDVGMTGARDSSLGVKSEVIIDRWLNGVKNRNILQEDGSWQFNGAIIEIDTKNYRVKLISSLNIFG